MAKKATQSQRVYDIHKSFVENITYGPFFTEKLPKLPTVTSQKTFLGHKLNSAFGLAASPMTFGSKNILLFSKLGYDILTYRSVRSVEWHGVEYPNWRYIDSKKQLTTQTLANAVTGAEQPFADQEISTANSFGIQSLAPALWHADFELTKKNLLPGQLLILALMITPETGADVVTDAGVVGKLAAQTSAEVFEINLACPNSGSSSLIYEDIETSMAVCKAVKKAIGTRKLLAKVGYYQDQTTIKQFLQATKGIIHGITSTNTYSMKVTDKKGADIFPGRPTAGISGGAVRELSMQQAGRIVEYKQELGMKDFVTIGVGGVLAPRHIRQYLDLGVDAVQAVTGVWADPYLALKYKGIQ